MHSRCHFIHESNKHLLWPTVELDRPTIQRGTFDSCNRCVTCTSKKMYCVLFLCIQQMNGCEPPMSEHSSSIVGDTAVMVWLDQCIKKYFI